MKEMLVFAGDWLKLRQLQRFVLEAVIIPSTSQNPRQ